MSKKEKLTSFDRLVLFTLTYSSLFKFSLTAEEILERLPITDDFDFLLAKKKKNEANKIIKNSKKIKRTLEKLIVLNLVKEKKDLYFLKDEDFKSRIKKEKFIKDKLKEAEEFVSLAKRIPFIKAIYLTGSAAVDNADKNDDLDFLIICQNNTLWLSRFILIILTKLKGKRPQLDADRKTVEETKDAWCLNLWLEESFLRVPKERRSLYEAYELMQMKSLYSKDISESKILSENKWLNKYLDLKMPHIKKKKRNSNLILITINRLLFFVQKNYRFLFYNDNGFLISINQAYLNDAAFKERLLKKLDSSFKY